MLNSSFGSSVVVLGLFTWLESFMDCLLSMLSTEGLPRNQSFTNISLFHSKDVIAPALTAIDLFPTKPRHVHDAHDLPSRAIGRVQLLVHLSPIAHLS